MVTIEGPLHQVSLVKQSKEGGRRRVEEDSDLSPQLWAIATHAHAKAADLAFPSCWIGRNRWSRCPPWILSVFREAWCVNNLKRWNGSLRSRQITIRGLIDCSSFLEGQDRGPMTSVFVHVRHYLEGWAVHVMFSCFGWEHVLANFQ